VSEGAAESAQRWGRDYSTVREWRQHAYLQAFPPDFRTHSDVRHDARVVSISGFLLQATHVLDYVQAPHERDVVSQTKTVATGARRRKWRPWKPTSRTVLSASRRKGPALSVSHATRRVHWPLIAALLPVLLGFGFHLAGVRAQPSQPGPDRPPLAFQQYVVDLGEVPPQRNHYARFAFTNRSSGRIKLRRLISSCGCLKQVLEQRVFEPGEHGQFQLRIQSANQTAGAKDYFCQVFYGPPDDPSVEFVEEVKLRMVLPERSVMLSPRVLMFHQPTPRPTTHPVDVTDLRERRLRVLAAVCEPPLATVTLLPRGDLTHDEATSGVVQRLQITVGAVPPGTHECVVLIQTDDAEFATLQLPLRIDGPGSIVD